MQVRVFVALCVVLSLTGCGTVVDHHQVTVRLSDPSHRLGTPVEGAIVQRTSNAALEPESKKQLTPLPLHDEVTGTRVVAGLDRSAAPSVELAFVIPKLSPDGYFLATLVPEDDHEKNTDAKLVRFGGYFPEEGAISIPLRYSGKGSGRGWTLDVIIDVPPQ